MRLSRRILTELGAREADAASYLGNMNRLMDEHGIDTRLRAAHFLSQVYHESTNLKRVVESLRYTTVDRLLLIFGNRIDADEASGFVRQPRRLANRVYAARLGNGSEASGDGWRFRGRGLIQLTGRSNYRAFARWLGEDVVADPDSVADEFAVHSAVFFWAKRGLNVLADADDVRAVTRRINGGLNGLADRMRLLDRAKDILRFDAGAAIVESGAQHRVSASRLNLRSSPRVAASTWLATLDQGTPVVLLGPSTRQGWVRVRALLVGRIVEGVVVERHLERLPAHETSVALTAGVESGETPPPEVHLSRQNRSVTRIRDGGRAHPLGEPNRPGRRATRPDTRARQLLAIAGWLDSENPEHLRYQRNKGTTYCNVYAYDYCYLAGGYLPRVWWTGSSLACIARGGSPRVEYARTVEEMTANRLHDWLGEFGAAYGWRRVTDLDVLQAAANAGDPCLITAQRTDLNRPGHISAVVPEGATRATRNARGEVLRPVESQAGRKNIRAAAQSSAWWRKSHFRAFGFWRHD